MGAPLLPSLERLLLAFSCHVRPYRQPYIRLISNPINRPSNCTELNIYIPKCGILKWNDNPGIFSRKSPQTLWKLRFLKFFGPRIFPNAMFCPRILFHGKYKDSPQEEMGHFISRHTEVKEGYRRCRFCCYQACQQVTNKVPKTIKFHSATFFSTWLNIGA